MASYLVLGGTGSLGKVLVETLLTKEVDSIRVYSRNEYFQVEMQRELNNPKLRFLIGDIRDKDRLRRAMDGVDYVVNCAALKHVPVCEYNPIEAIKTNIDGAVNIIDCAIDTKVKKVVHISSDKAVEPINLYGATKLVAEKLFIHSNIYGKDKTFFSCIRFGNFFGSRGSVIPLWMRQKETGKITLTDKDMTRFWIHIDKACKFILMCINEMKGGEIFIPKMDEIIMEEMAKLIAPDCDIEITGKRFGEKLSEKLFSDCEKIEHREGYYIVNS